MDLVKHPGVRLSHESRSTPGEHVALTLDEQASRVFCCGLHGHLQLASLLCSLPHSFPSLPRPRPFCSGQEALPTLLLSLKQPFRLFPAPSPQSTALTPALCFFLPPGSTTENMETLFISSEIWFENTALPFNVYPQHVDAAWVFIIHF